MPRKILIRHERMETQLPCALLDDLAPRSAAFLWSLAGSNAEFAVNHAIWTGPELSCPLPAGNLPPGVDTSPLPTENASSYPRAGDVGLVWLPSGSTRGLPTGDFFDIGIFYDDGARLLMPFGWIKANIAATIAPSDLHLAQEFAWEIRHRGGCRFRISRADDSD